MGSFNLIASLFSNSDRANSVVLDAANNLSNAELDHAFNMGVGTLRRTLLHIWAGESVWLQRWQGHVETPWPDESEAPSIQIIRPRFTSVWRRRDAPSVRFQMIHWRRSRRIAIPRAACSVRHWET